MRFTEVIFDLDGVVIDSAHAIRAAYINAGVNPPENILAQEGKNWLAEQCGEDKVDIIKAKKADEYHEAIALGRVPLLSGYYTALRLKAQGHHITLLSAAPANTVLTICKWLGDDKWPFDASYDNMPRIDKAIYMRRRAVQGIRGVYIDDQDRLAETPVSWKFIRYSKQGVETLYSEITR